MSPSRRSAASLLGEHVVIGLDSNVLIYLLEGVGLEADIAGSLLDAIAVGPARGVLATLAIAEVAAGPARTGDMGLVERYVAELRSLDGFAIVPLDVDVAREAAILRGLHGMTLGDAIHLASAHAAGATAFVTADHRIRPVTGLQVVYLSGLRS